MEKMMLNKLYKNSQSMIQSKLFEQFNKLLDCSAADMDEEDMKRTRKLVLKKLDKVT